MYNLSWAAMARFVENDYIHYDYDGKGDPKNIKIPQKEASALYLNTLFDRMEDGAYYSFVIGPREVRFGNFLENPVVKERCRLHYQSKPFCCVAHKERPTDQSVVYIFQKVK